MEFTLSGTALKTFARSIACLSRIGNDLAIQASPSQLSFHALNSSRSAYQLITFKPDLFDIYIWRTSSIEYSFEGIKKTYRIACNVEPQRTTTICG